MSLFSTPVRCLPEANYDTTTVGRAPMFNHAFSHDILLYKMNQACTARTIIFKDNGNEFFNGERCTLLSLAQGHEGKLLRVIV